MTIPRKTTEINNCILWCPYPANTKHLYNICTTSAQRRRRWSTNVLCLLGRAVMCGTPLSGILWPVNYADKQAGESPFVTADMSLVRWVTPKLHQFYNPFQFEREKWENAPAFKFPGKKFFSLLTRKGSIYREASVTEK